MRALTIQRPYAHMIITSQRELPVRAVTKPVEFIPLPCSLPVSVSLCMLPPCQVT